MSVVFSTLFKKLHKSNVNTMINLDL